MLRKNKKNGACKRRKKFKRMDKHTKNLTASGNLNLLLMDLFDPRPDLSELIEQMVKELRLYRDTPGVRQAIVIRMEDRIRNLEAIESALTEQLPQSWSSLSTIAQALSRCQEVDPECHGVVVTIPFRADANAAHFHHLKIATQ